MATYFSKHTHITLFFAVAFLYSVFLYWFQPIESNMHHDSPGLLNFASLHPSGYPLFIDVIEHITGSPLNVVFFQILFAGFSTAFLAYVLLIRFRNAFLGYAILIGVFANPFLAKIHCWIIGDSIFSSLVAMFFAVLILIDLKPSYLKFAMASFLMGLAITIKPVAASLIPLWAFIFWIYWPTLKTMRLPIILLCALLPLLTLHGLDKAYYHSVHGSQTETLLNRHLFAKAVMGHYEVSAAQYGSEFSSAVQQFRDQTLIQLEQTNDPILGLYILRNREVFAQHKFENSSIRHGAAFQNKDVESFLYDFGVQGLLNAPASYLKTTLRNYFGLWLVYINTNNLPSTMPFLEASFLGLVRIGVFFLCLGTFLLTSLGLATLVFNKKHLVSSKYCLSFLSALYIHGYFLLIAFTGVFVSRYTLNIWPVFVLSIILFSLQILEKHLNKPNKVSIFDNLQIKT